MAFIVAILAISLLLAHVLVHREGGASARASLSPSGEQQLEGGFHAQ